MLLALRLRYIDIYIYNPQKRECSLQGTIMETVAIFNLQKIGRLQTVTELLIYVRSMDLSAHEFASNEGLIPKKSIKLIDRAIDLDIYIYIYPLVNVYITMERYTIFHGKTHYFDWAIFNSYVTVITRPGMNPYEP